MMESKIQFVLTDCFPEVLKEETELSEHTKYIRLRQCALYALKLMQQKKSDTVREIFETADNLYQFGSLHDRNAIENEFLHVLAQEEKTMLLQDHLKLMPKTLKSVYIKTILEN